jgi:signal transduction histidine kinase
MPRESGAFLNTCSSKSIKYNYFLGQVSFIYKVITEFFYAGNDLSKALQVSFYAVVLYQFAFVSVQASFARRREYIYYLLYMICIVPYFLSTAEFGLGIPIIFTQHPELAVYFDKPIIILNFLFYTNFARHFLDIPALHPGLNKIIDRMIVVYVLLGLIGIFVMFYTQDVFITETLFATFYLSLFVTLTWILLKLIAVRSTQLNYFVVAGAVLVIIGSTTAMIFFNLRNLGQLPQSFIPSVPAQVFILGELLVFTTGLGYKTNLLEIQKNIAEKKLTEELKEKEQLRQQIAENLHDDMGATLSSISIYANVAQKMLAENKFETSANYIARIYRDSTDMMQGLREIVWTIKPGNDTFQNLWDKMNDHAKPLLAAKGVNVILIAEEELFELSLSALQRRNIFFIFKEAVNNIVKYAQCGEVSVKAKRTEEQLELSITDNGIGFEMKKSISGMGLISMPHRANELNGGCKIMSEKGAGTRIVLVLPIHL